MEVDESSEFEFSNSKDKYVFYLRINSFKPLDTNPDSFNKNNFIKPIFVPIPMKYILIEEESNHQCNKKRKMNDY